MHQSELKYMAACRKFDRLNSKYENYLASPFMSNEKTVDWNIRLQSALDEVTIALHSTRDYRENHAVDHVS